MGYTTSANYKTQVRESGHRWHVRGELHLYDPPVNTVLELTDADIMAQNPFKLTWGTSRQNSFDLGMAVMKMITLTLNNHTGRFTNYDLTDSVFYMEVGLELTDGTTEWINVGKYTLDKPMAKTVAMTAIAVDDMYKFDKAYDDYEVTYPATLADIIADCATQCNVNWTPTSFLNSTMVVQNAPINTTHRQVLGMIAQLACKFAYIDYAGNLKLGWYAIDAVNGYALDSYKAFSVGLQDTLISGIRYKPEDLSTPIVYGTDSHSVIVIERNLLLDVANYHNALTNLIGAIQGFTFRQYTCQTFTDFSIDCGDAVILTTPDTTEYATIVSNITHAVYGGSSYSGDSETLVKNRTGAFSPTAQIQAIAASQSELRMTAFEEMVMEANAAVATAKGYYETKIYGADGRILEYYQHDQVLKSNSTYITRIMAGAVAFSNDGGLNYTTFMSAAGASIPQLASRLIVADLIKAGKIQSIDGNTYFDLDIPEIKQTVIVNGETYYIKINGTDGFAIFRGATKIFGISTSTGNIETIGDITADDITSGSLQSVNGVIILDLDAELFYFGNHILSLVSGSLQWSSSQSTATHDYIFKRADANPVSIEVFGRIFLPDTASAIQFGTALRAEVRTDTDNEGVDFVF